MRGVEKHLPTRCEGLIDLGRARGFEQKTFAAIRAGICSLAFAGFMFVAGCQTVRSRLGIGPDPAQPAPSVATPAPGTEPAQTSPIVQTGGAGRAEMPVLPIDIPRDVGPKTQGTSSSATNLPAAVTIQRDGADKPPAFPKAAPAPAKLPASFELPNDIAPKPQAPAAQRELSMPTRENTSERVAELSRAAVARYQTIDSYIARFRRREVVGSSAKPEELMLFKFRKQPWSVYFKWLGAEGQGREVVFVEGKYGNLLHTLLAAGDMPLMPAGKRFSISPDSSLVRNRSRHTIREAGIGALINQFAKLVESSSKGDTHLGTLRYVGPIKRSEFEQPCEAVEQTIPPGAEPGLPNGGRRLWVFDSATSQPLLTVAYDGANKEVEYYCYDRLQYPAQLTDDDFNPDVLWRPRQ